MLRLTAGDTILDINPAIAGAMWRLTHKGRDALRPTADGMTDALMTANFPLVPWCNRLRDGAFVAEGRKVQLPRNFGDSPHPLHGHGWQTAGRCCVIAISRMPGLGIMKRPSSMSCARAAYAAS